MKNIGIMLAGGSGRRVGGKLPKQFLTVAGKTIFEHTLSVFQSHKDIHEIIVVTHRDYIHQTETLVKQNFCPKPIHILAGGTERYRSTLVALQACPDTECLLVIHDAVRPLVTHQMITDCLEALDEAQACTMAIPSSDTILISDATHHYIQEIPDRQFLYRVQTPQAFRKTILQQAYEKAKFMPDFHPTDDCGVIRYCLPGIPIKILAGSPSNIKITYPEDLAMIEKILTAPAQ